MEMKRRESLRVPGAFPLALVAGGAGAFLGGCNDPSEPGRGLASAGQTLPPVATPSPAAYAILDPRNPNNVIAPLHLPRADGGVPGNLDLPSAPVTMTAGPTTPGTPSRPTVRSPGLSGHGEWQDLPQSNREPVIKST
jgi:hypothetical protein